MGIVEETLESIRLTRKKYTQVASKLEKRIKELKAKSAPEKHIKPIAKRLEWIATGLERLDEEERQLAKKITEEE